MDVKRVLLFILGIAVTFVILSVAWPLIVIGVLCLAIYLGYQYYKIRKLHKQMEDTTASIFDDVFSTQGPSSNEDIIDVDYTVVDEKVNNEENRY